MRILIILTILIEGCASTSVIGPGSKSNKDILILSILIQDHLRKTDGRDINLAELLQADTLNRISNSFEKIELKSKRGYISAYYKFTESRDSDGIKLSSNEEKLTNYFTWVEKDLKNHYDGEIRLDYGERFYRVRKIIVSKLAN